MGGEDKILVYENRAGDSGKKTPTTMTKLELHQILKDNPTLQATDKATNGKSCVTVYQSDLYTAAQKAIYEGTPTYETNIADVKIPRTGPLSTKRYSVLTILSEKKEGSNV